MLTWGDGVSTVDLHELLAFHRSHGKLATVTAVRPPARFGRLEIEADQVVSFNEKPQMSEGWINGAFFVLEPGIFDYIDNDMTHVRARADGAPAPRKVSSWRSATRGFWQCMDTLRDKVRLEELWESGEAPWKVWELGSMRVLVTGCDGYIGQVLVPLLQSAGHEVTGLDSGLFADCVFPGQPRPTRPSCGATCATSARPTSAGFDAVLHLAGLSNDPLGDLDPAMTDAVNHRASVRLAKLAKAAGVSRFVFASSCSNYGCLGRRIPR